MSGYAIARCPPVKVNTFKKLTRITHKIIFFNPVWAEFCDKLYVMAAYTRKTWVEKRDNGKAPEVKRVKTDFADLKAGERMLIATPGIVDAYIRHIPSGKDSTLHQMRKDLAAQYHADKTCPVTSGIFLRIVAEAAWEEYQQGKPLKAITPFWRILNSSSPTAKKLSFGMEFLMQQRKKEKLT